MKRKILASILTIALVISTIPMVASAAGFKDVTSDKYYYNSVLKCADKGFVSGYEDGSFRPNGKITRAEFATIMNKVLGLNDPAPNSFSDVKNGKWYTIPVLNCVKAGIISGYGDGKVGIGDPVTREQAAVILAKAFGIAPISGSTAFTDNGSISSWARGSVKGMYSAGKITGMATDKGEHYFAPKQNLTRGQICVLLIGCLEKEDLTTVPDPYKPIIQECIQFVQGYDVDNDLFSGGHDEFSSASEIFWYARRTDNPLEAMGYCLIDLDKDGSPELVISSTQTDTSKWYGYPMMALIYTIKDGKAQHVAGSWSRSARYLGDDGFIYYYGSGGAAYSHYRKEVLENGQLYALETAFSDLTYVSGQPIPKFCYTKGHELVTDLPDSFLRWEAAQRSDLTEKEWLGILDSWRGHYKAFSCISFQRYLRSDQV